MLEVVVATSQDAKSEVGVSITRSLNPTFNKRRRQEKFAITKILHCGVACYQSDRKCMMRGCKTKSDLL